MYKVNILPEAEDDIFAIYNYIVMNDSQSKAIKVLDKLELQCTSLTNEPERGHFVPELYNIGIKEFREIHFKPYRIIFQIEGSKVYIHCVLDGRRELSSILEQRILR